MNVASQSPGWQSMATIEIDNSEHSMHELQRIVPSYVRTRECAESPPGYRWVELILEDLNGEFEAKTASDVLAALQIASAMFQTFRIVSGDQWLKRSALA